jgi:hypothetical protein
MIITHNEEVSSNFKGTIIDFETIGEFSKQFAYNDSRQYLNLKPTILGYINNSELKILCAEGKDAIAELIEQTVKIVPLLEKPLFAFQSGFERGVLYHSCGMQIEFDGELNKATFEKKLYACSDLGIGDYGDPFNHDGLRCKLAWENGDYEKAISHNRNCLLTERDILLKRGYREPDAQNFM